MLKKYNLIYLIWLLTPNSFPKNDKSFYYMKIHLGNIKNKIGKIKTNFV